LVIDQILHILFWHLAFRPVVASWKRFALLGLKKNLSLFEFVYTIELTPKL